MSILPASVTDLAPYVVHAAAAAPRPSGVPDAGGGEAPPGAEDLLHILRWVAWTVTALCVGGIFGVAARMATDYAHGGGRDHVRGLGFVMAACLLVGSASGIVGALV